MARVRRPTWSRCGTVPARLSALDASYIALERHGLPMNVGGFVILGQPPDVPPLTLGKLRTRMASRAESLSRLRQRLYEVPLGLARPMWGDDPDFAVEDHVRELTLPPPGSRRELEADADLYGKESAGDLCEGKRTVMLLHYLRTATPSCRRRAVRLLRMPRAQKCPSEVAWLYSAMRRAGSLERARGLALDYSNRALGLDGRPQPYLTDGADRRFLRGMLRYVVERVK